MRGEPYMSARSYHATLAGCAAAVGLSKAAAAPALRPNAEFRPLFSKREGKSMQDI